MHVSPSWLGCSTIQCTTSRYKVSISGASGSCICYITRAGGGGGGVNPTSMAQNDTHVALIILTTQMLGGGGGELLVEKTFSGQNLYSCAFGANICSYTKQRARHETPFLQPPRPSAGVHVTPPPPPPGKSNFSGPPFLCRARRAAVNSALGIDWRSATGMGACSLRLSPSPNQMPYPVNSTPPPLIS